jgi:hypothetical protein
MKCISSAWWTLALDALQWSLRLQESYVPGATRSAAGYMLPSAVATVNGCPLRVANDLSSCIFCECWLWQLLERLRFLPRFLLSCLPTWKGFVREDEPCPMARVLRVVALPSYFPCNLSSCQVYAYVPLRDMVRGQINLCLPLTLERIFSVRYIETGSRSIIWNSVSAMHGDGCRGCYLSFPLIALM